jgi:hypothetical protein
MNDYATFVERHFPWNAEVLGKKRASMPHFPQQILRWSRGCVFASSTEVRGFKPGRSRRIFQGEKIPSTPSFGGEVKPAVPCRRFTACKRSLNVTWKAAFSQNYRL